MFGSPYICVRRSASGVEFEGQASCNLGYRTKTAAGGNEEGIFACWQWDGTRLTVRNDRYGFFPLFYFRDTRGVCISTSLAKLLERGASNQLNAAGLAVFLRLGWFIGDESPFQNILAMPPGATLEWQNGECWITSSGLPIAKPQQIGTDDALETYVALFRAAIHRCAPPSDEFVVPLSGGRDSRHILLELCEAGFRPAACLTQRKLPKSAEHVDEDVAIAAQLCGTLGIRHVVVEQNPDRLSAELRKNRQTEFCAMEHAWGLPFADRLSAWDYAYDGIGGDMLSEGGVDVFDDGELDEDGSLLSPRRLALFEEGKLEVLADEILGRDDGYLPTILLEPQYRRFSRALAVESLVAELGRHANAPNPISSFYFHNRTRRSIALGTLATWRARRAVFMPYLDHALYDFLTSLPARFFLECQFHTEAIRRAHPSYSRIPFHSRCSSEVSGPSFDYTANCATQFALDTGGLCLRRPRGHLLRRSSLVLRILRALVDRSYRSEVESLGALAAYLYQLEELCDGKGVQAGWIGAI